VPHSIRKHAPAADQPRLLEYHAERHAGVRERAPGQRGDVTPHHTDMPGGRPQQAGDAFQESGFAATILAEDDQEFAGRQ
jgi:hypothetical protein